MRRGNIEKVISWTSSALHECLPSIDSLSNIVLFSREETLTQETISLFSVATPHKPDVLKARAIVTNQGDSLGNGTWSCTRDTRHTCVHISQAKKYLLKINGIDETHSEDDTAVEIDEMEGEPS